MEVFYLTLEQMLLMFLLIVVGFAFRKKKLLPDNAYSAFSKLETYLLVPSLTLYTQINKCTVASLTENWMLILYGAAVVLFSMVLAYPLSKLFVPNAASSPVLTYQRNIYKYAMTFGNYGFMGDFLVLGVFGEDVFFRYKLFTLGVAVMCSGWGLFILIPKDQNSSMLSKLKKGLVTPPLIAIVVGIAAGLLGLKNYIPQFIMRALDSAGKCQGPVAMVLAGLVIGGYNLKELLTNKKVYLASLLRLIILPGIIALILKALGTEEQIVTLALICFATPLGLNTIVYPATYGGDTKTGASMTVISHTLSVITIPLMYLVFITIL